MDKVEMLIHVTTQLVNSDHIWGRVLINTQ